MTYQIWRDTTKFNNPTILVTFDYSHQASVDYAFTMKEFDCIVSGQLDNPSSNVESYLSDDNDKPDLQQTLIEESWQRRLNCIRLMGFKQAQQRYKRKPKKVSVTALLKQINHDRQTNVVVIDLVEPNETTGMYLISIYFYVSKFIILHQGKTFFTLLSWLIDSSNNFREM